MSVSSKGDTQTTISGFVLFFSFLGFLYFTKFDFFLLYFIDLDVDYHTTNLILKDNESTCVFFSN